MADKLASLGYTMEDLLMMHFGGSDHPKDIENPRWSADLGEEEDESKSILLKLNIDIDNILEGNIAVKYTDTRTYAQVLLTSQ